MNLARTVCVIIYSIIEFKGIKMSDNEILAVFYDELYN